jgi:NAD(P)-dependent dehydrogenase (short-subunit alcohol dehydrogenase family)
MPVCVVVGAGPGVGLAVARRFAREGFVPVLLARRADNLAALAATLEAEGHSPHAYAASATDEFQLNGALHQIEADLGGVDVLVYNAAAVRQATPSQLAPDDFLADLRAGVVGALVCAQAVLPGMRSLGHGTLLFTGGGFAFEPMAALASLGVEKAALRNLAFSLHQELAPEGIHAAMVTIGGMVGSSERFAPEAIAEAYWTLHAQPLGAYEREIVWR